MNIYLLDNKIPLANSEDRFADGFHESPGWDYRMSIENRGLCAFYPFEGRTRQPAHGSGRGLELQGILGQEVSEG